MRWERLNDTSRKFWAAELQELIKMTDILVVIAWSGERCQWWCSERWSWAGRRGCRCCLSSQAGSWLHLAPHLHIHSVPSPRALPAGGTASWATHLGLLKNLPWESPLPLGSMSSSTCPVSVHLLWSMAAKLWCDGQFPASIRSWEGWAGAGGGRGAVSELCCLPCCCTSWVTKDGSWCHLPLLQPCFKIKQCQIKCCCCILGMVWAGLKLQPACGCARMARWEQRQNWGWGERLCHVQLLGISSGHSLALAGVSHTHCHCQCDQCVKAAAL